MSRMHAWPEDRPTEGEPENVFEERPRSGPRRPKMVESTAPARMPTPSPATQCIVDPSVCRQRAADILLMEAGEGFETAEDVEKGPDHPGIGGQQYEPPLENRGFGRGANVDRYEDHSRRSLRGTKQHHAVQHRASPASRKTFVIR